MIVILCLLGAIVFYFTLSWLWRRLKKKGSREPPLLPGDLPFIGHTHLVYGDTVFLWKMLKKFAYVSLDNGGVTTAMIGTWTIYCDSGYLMTPILGAGQTLQRHITQKVVTDPDDCMLIGNTFLEKDELYDLAKPWLGQGLVTSPVHVWKRHRKLINPALNQYVLDGYLSVFNKQSRRLADNLLKEAGNGYFNHELYIKRTFLETICLTVTGIKDKDELLENVRYMDAVDEIFNIMAKRVIHAYMLSNTLFNFTSLKRKHDDLIKILHGMSNKIIQKRKSELLGPESVQKNLNNTPKRFKSFLDLLLESSVDGSLSDIEIREEVDTMIAAGYDTTTTMMIFALVLIGSYPHVQEKIYQELQEVFEGSDRDVEKHDLAELVYLEAVLKETLRFYPVAPFISRHLTRDVELKNYTLSGGNSCIFLIHGIHRHSSWGPDREKFNPERWLNPSELPTNAFFGFGVGKRSCIGPKFAYMLAKTTLCHILRRYRVTADHTKMILKMDVLLKPESGYFIKIEAR